MFIGFIACIAFAVVRGGKHVDPRPVSTRINSISFCAVDKHRSCQNPCIHHDDSAWTRRPSIPTGATPGKGRYANATHVKQFAIFFRLLFRPAGRAERSQVHQRRHFGPGAPAVIMKPKRAALGRQVSTFSSCSYKRTSVSINHALKRFESVIRLAAACALCIQYVAW